MNSSAKPIHAEDVANYLNRNRDFFHVFPNLLNELSIPHPTSGREVSLIERQLVQLREQRDDLQTEIDTLKDIAGENGVLLHKVYEFGFALLRAADDQAIVDEVYAVMRAVFDVEEISLLSWELPTQNLVGISQLGISQNWSEAMKTTLQLDKPVCGLLEDAWQKGLFSNSDPVQSVCLIPLGEKRLWGVLALGSRNDRFKPDLGTYFLKIMGQMLSARLGHLFA